ncbi:hypothetical protein VP1G_02326 [Cytospora mali]|uniref:Uncharacterized protein n=1 Tax=Cytospora mali TaxID=578113 RepID=A0A194UTS5_CYTMA|nr:hypothetical protein VP1G_02326 [Valsa mali var. pyri (nom. inval.)]
MDRSIPAGIPPEECDAQNIVLSGSALVWNFTLAAATDLQRHSEILKETLRALSAVYPPTNMTISPAEKTILGGSLLPVPPLLRILMNASRSWYLPPGIGPAGPRIAVLIADRT